MRSSWSSAVGPSSRLPNTVRVSSTPLVRSVGTRRMMALTRSCAGLSIDHELALARADGKAGVAARELLDPVAEKAGGVDHEAGGELALASSRSATLRRCCVSPRHGGAREQRRPVHHRLADVAERRAPRIDDAFVRNLDRAEGAGCEVAARAGAAASRSIRFAATPLATEWAAIAGELVQLVRVPRDDQRAGVERSGRFIRSWIRR